MTDEQILANWQTAVPVTPEMYRALYRLECSVRDGIDAAVMAHELPLEQHSTQYAERMNAGYTASIADESESERAYREGTTSRAEQARMRYERGGR